MTNTDAARFAQCLAVLSETFNESISDLRAEAYFLALSDLDIEDIEGAVKDAIRTLRFFPKPVELRDLILGSAQQNAEEAWHTLKYEVRRVGYIGKPKLDAVSQYAVDAAMGGWRYVCTHLPAEENHVMRAMEEEFKNAYVREFNIDPQKQIDSPEVKRIG